jgi:N-acetyl-beta-hexosaminidase
VPKKKDFEFLENVFAEVSSLPGREYFNIGGDDV